MGELAVCAAGSDSMCRHVRYTSKRRSKMPRRVIEGSNSSSSRPRRLNKRCLYTCGLTRTRSMNKTTKSCSTYLSANRLQRGHCVNLTSPPPPPPPPPLPPAFRFPNISVLSRPVFTPRPISSRPTFLFRSCTGLVEVVATVTDCLV